jgi:hypothetical protein
VTDNADGTKTFTRAGTVVQQGTNQDDEHFNNIEVGLSDAETAAALLLFAQVQKNREKAAQEQTLEKKVEDLEQTLEGEAVGETKTVTLQNTATCPFNSTLDSPATVALSQVRKNLFYTVEAVVDSADGMVGDIHITDKALNGFKVAYDGSGKSVTITLKIKGGTV